MSSPWGPRRRTPPFRRRRILGRSTRVPGGSSGGSAAAVAAGEAIASLGSDTGRFDPAAGGVVQCRRTQAHVRTGLALRTDRVRLVARPDRTLCPQRGGCGDSLGAIAGHDPLDSTSFHTGDSRLSGGAGSAPRDRGGWGFPRNTLAKASTPRWLKRCSVRSRTTSSLGCEVKPVSLAAHRVRRRHLLHHRDRGGSSNLARYDGVRYGHRSKARRMPWISISNRGPRVLDPKSSAASFWARMCSPAATMMRFICGPRRCER
jgi:aspartyl-tRNA(Asn)/glutamyl-tRNA(Gln) amidotransferase subunit A